MHVFNLLQTKLYVLLMFSAVCFNGMSKNHELPLLHLFLLVMLLCTVDESSSAVIFVWSYKVILSEKQRHIIKFV